MEEFDYHKAQLENIHCSLCGATDFFVLARRSANNLPVQTCLCKRCGLIYINPRMTKEEYDNYYKYFYRQDRQAIKGHDEYDEALDVNFENGRKFGRALAQRLTDHITKSGLALDIGSSTGGVLYGFKEVVPNLTLLGVEPSVAESKFANDYGVPTRTYLFEDFIASKDLPADCAMILCVRTLNHLLNPKAFFQWSYNHLRPDGVLILEVKNFRHQARRTGSVAAGVQIDHPYMFTPETLKALLEASGFNVVYMDVDEYKDKATAVRQRREGLSVHHIRLAAIKKSDQEQATTVTADTTLYRRLRRQFSRFGLKFYYWLFYAQKLSFLRRFLPFLSRN